MSYKLIFRISILALMSLLYSACEMDPEFPDPGFELEDQRVEVRRDTADVYTVKMKMEVPNGVNKIEVLNATNYALINQVDGYAGKTDFEFIYDIDLRSFDKDTTLYYIFKVTDKDNRTFNRGFTLLVKRFSFPEIRLVGGNSLNVVVPVYQLKGLVSTGLNELDSIIIKFRGMRQWEYAAPADSAIYNYKLSQRVGFGSLNIGDEYTLEIIIKDRNGQTSNTFVTVRKSDKLKRPTGIGMITYNGKIRSIDLTYDNNNRLSNFVYTYDTGGKHYYSLSYRNDGLVDTISVYYRVDLTSKKGYTHLYQIFTYIGDTKKLDKIYHSEVFYHDNGSIETIADKVLESHSFVYDSKGGIQSFYGKSATINMQYVDPFGTGEAVFVDYWQSYSYHEMTDIRRQHREGFEPIYMPTYIDGLPPFFNLNVFQTLFCDLFLDKYVVTGTKHSSSLYTGVTLEEPSYTYETDADGNLTKYTKNYTYQGWQKRVEVYSFKY